MAIIRTFAVALATATLAVPGALARPNHPADLHAQGSDRAAASAESPSPEARDVTTGRGASTATDSARAQDLRHLLAGGYSPHHAPTAIARQTSGIDAATESARAQDLRHLLAGGYSPHHAPTASGRWSSGVDAAPLVIGILAVGGLAAVIRTRRTA